jgi:hypothetical protein
MTFRWRDPADPDADGATVWSVFWVMDPEGNRVEL